MRNLLKSLHISFTEPQRVVFILDEIVLNGRKTLKYKTPAAVCDRGEMTCCVLQMLRIPLWLHVGACVWGFAFSIKCPDGSSCSDPATCCQTEEGYECCPYTNVSLTQKWGHFMTVWISKSGVCLKAVCCSDLTNCCPPGFTCNLALQLCVKQNQPWMSVPMVKKEAAEAPSTPDLPVSTFRELKGPDLSGQKATIVHCDNYYYCYDGTTCCRHPKGGWFCCPYSPVSMKKTSWLQLLLFIYKGNFFCLEYFVLCRGGVVWMATTAVHMVLTVTTLTPTASGKAWHIRSVPDELWPQSLLLAFQQSRTEATRGRYKLPS